MHGVAIARRRIAKIRIRHDHPNGNRSLAIALDGEVHGLGGCRIAEFQKGHHASQTISSRRIDTNPGSLIRGSGLGHPIAVRCIRVLIGFDHPPVPLGFGFDVLPYRHGLGIGNHKAAQIDVLRTDL